MTMVHKGQKIRSDGETFKVLHIVKDDEDQTKIMDEFHEKLGTRIYGMGHDQKLVVAMKDDRIRWE